MGDKIGGRPDDASAGLLSFPVEQSARHFRKILRTTAILRKPFRRITGKSSE